MTSPTVTAARLEDLIYWLDKKYSRHHDEEDKEAADALREYAALRARSALADVGEQLSARLLRIGEMDDGPDDLSYSFSLGVWHWQLPEDEAGSAYETLPAAVSALEARFPNGTGKQPRTAAEEECGTCGGSGRVMGDAFDADRYDVLVQARTTETTPCPGCQGTRVIRRVDFEGTPTDDSPCPDCSPAAHTAQVSEALKAGVMCLEAEALRHRHPEFSKGATMGDVTTGMIAGSKASDDKLRHAAVLRRLAEQGSGAKP